MFDLGQWVIDTKKQDAVEVVTIPEGGAETVCRGIKFDSL